MRYIKLLWGKYIQWCDLMGLTPESKRCCAPQLSDPQLKSSNRNFSITAMSAKEQSKQVLSNTRLLQPSSIKLDSQHDKGLPLSSTGNTREIKS